MDEIKIFGLLGEKLTHSYSKIIHEYLGDKYEMFEVSRDDFPFFMEKKEFDAINVTIPYKEMVIPYLDYIDERARKIGAVNTIVKKNNQLYGYNTDYDGFKFILEKNNFSIENSKCLILGTGGTSKTVYNVLNDLKAQKIDKASRSGKDGALKYENIDYNSYDYLINTTPVGMYPNIFDSIVSHIDNIKGVVDVIFNPFRTKFILENRDKLYANGLDMLIYQAIKSHELFLDKEICFDKLEEIRAIIKKTATNIVLIGMPGCGKSTIGKKLAEELDMEYYDTDNLIEQKTNQTIPDIFSKFGEKKFREIEKEVIKEVSLYKNCVISTGGGSILDIDNVYSLMANGVVFYINRSIEGIYSNLQERPLAKNKNDLLRIYEERKEIYNNSNDYVIDNNGDINDAISKIKSLIFEFYKK